MKARRAFTLVEATISMLLTGVMLVGAVRATSSAVRLRATVSDRVVGQKLASGLMNDIVALAYADTKVTPVFGLESGESATLKAGWNDVDDFNGWSESPPQDRFGVVMSDLTGWKRTVKVEWVSILNGSSVVSTESGAKRITVTVSKNNAVVCTRVALRSAAP